MHASEVAENEVPLSGGFGTIDEKGRVTVSKPVREALGIEPGSSVAYLVMDGALLIIPQDQQLAALMERAQQVLHAGGITTQSILDELPTARAQIAEEAYGAEFLGEMEQLRARLVAE